MLRIHASAYMDLCSSLSRLETLVENLSDAQKEVAVEKDFADQLTLRRADAACSAIGLEVGIKQVERITSAVESGITYRDLGQMVGELRRRIQDESATKVFIHIPPDHVKYFDAPKLFGELVTKHFPKSTKDVDEAGKCLGNSRGTATVFHLMRVMEHGLNYLATRLGIDYQPSWEAYLTKIQKQIDLRHDQKSQDWKRDEPFFKDVLGDLTAVKTAWRNPTMHIERHYDFDEAEDVFRAVKRLIGRLAQDAEASVRATQPAQQPTS